FRSRPASSSSRSCRIWHSRFSVPRSGRLGSRAEAGLREAATGQFITTGVSSSSPLRSASRSERPISCDDDSPARASPVSLRSDLRCFTPKVKTSTNEPVARLTLRQMLNKVPEVTLYFWVIKVLCTTVGETASDYLSDNVGLGLTKTTFITASVLVATLVFQF